MNTTLTMLAGYKAWANQLTFESVLALPEGEADKQRQTNFGTITHTLNHVFVVDDIFRHHIKGQRHGYEARNTKSSPPIAELWELQQEMDKWWLDFARALLPKTAKDIVEFEFVGGGDGRMTREQILLHIVNHGTYHRGFVNDMMYQVPARPPANDLPVYLREQQG